MFPRLKRICKLLKYFIFAKYTWDWPRQSDVLIFDACHQELLLRFFDPCIPEILHVRGEQINMRVLMSSIFNRGSKTEAYVDCFIRQVCPRLVVTYIDNNINFLTISKRHPNVKTLFIQNGLRSYHEDLFAPLDEIDSSLLSHLKVDYMLTFGSLIGEEYSRYIAGTVVPIGSMKNNLVRKMPAKQKGVIGYISTWRKVSARLYGEHYTEHTYITPVDRIIISNLLCYSKAKNKRLMIISKNPNNGKSRKQEEEHFRNLLNQEPEFFDQPEPYPSYQSVDLADVVVGTESTLSYESIARGNKTAIFSVTGEFLGIPGLNYGWPGDFHDEGLFWTNIPCSKSFYRILDYLFTVEAIQWEKDVDATNFSSLMVYDPENSKLKEILRKELRAPSVMNIL